MRALAEHIARDERHHDVEVEDEEAHEEEEAEDERDVRRARGVAQAL